VLQQDTLVIEDFQEFTGSIDKIEQEVTLVAEQMKAMIDQHRDKLLDELRDTKDIQRTQSNEIRNKIKERSTDMKNTKTQLEILLSRSTVSELASHMTSVHDTVDDLLRLDVVQSAVTELAANKVNFKASKPSGNMVGKVTARVKTSTGL